MAKFQEIKFYSQKKEKGYQLLPFKFSELDTNNYLLTNIAGEFVVLKKDLIRPLVEHQLDDSSEEYVNLRSRQFLQDTHNQVAIDLLALKLRTRLINLPQFTALHIFVVSLRCEHSCPYCQVSRQSEDKTSFDMTKDCLLYTSPSPRDRQKSRMPSSA